MYARFLSFCVLILALGLAACSTDTSSAADPVPPAPLSGTYRDVGPFAAGVTTLTLADRLVEVWYPVNAPDVAGMSPVPYFIRDELSDTLQSILADDINPPFQTAAYRDAPASANGAFPLVIFAHGVSSYRNQSTFQSRTISFGSALTVANKARSGRRTAGP